MKRRRRLLLLLRVDTSLLILLLNIIMPCQCEHYTNTWAIRIEGGEQYAREIAEQHGFHYIGEIMEDYYHLSHHSVERRSISHSQHQHDLLSSTSKVLWFEQQQVRSRRKRDYATFNDVKWTDQWYLHRPSADDHMLDMNLVTAWNKGYTGNGVVVTILDDGIEWNHPDLLQNYDWRASKDINGGDNDPMPRYDFTNENRHGTRCAGEVAAAANNTNCGVGVAFRAKIGGIRMLDGDVTDAVEATALSFNRDHIDIYSASWGPDDDGKTIDGPAPLAREAFRQGILNGRRGKGSIFVWASGNGGRYQDSCNCDGYTNSIYTLSISSATEFGLVPWYSEACSSTLATTYSSGDVNEKQIITTDLNRSCTSEHTGTSASAPLAAGIVALALEANPSLTWRDMQYLVVMSANPNSLKADDWVVNGAGRRVSHHFGYGMMNAGKMVDLAKNWTNVPPQKICEIQYQRQKVVPASSRTTVQLTTDGCSGTSNHVVYLEHVQARISLTSKWRGDIQIYLKSPMGTISTLLASRTNDASADGFNQWAFMTTHNWGELAEGNWQLEVHNGYRAAPATLQQFILVLYGTSVNPVSDLQVTASGVAGANRCGSDSVMYRDECYDHCPHGWFPMKRVCYSCHNSCASCYSADNTSCTECYHGAVLIDGVCITGRKILAGNSNQDDGLTPNTLWWLMVGATVAVCMLVTFLVILAVYYAYSQGYMCDGANSSTSGSPSPGSSETTETPNGNSKHSSQQELMSSEDESEELDERITEFHRMMYV